MREGGNYSGTGKGNRERNQEGNRDTESETKRKRRGYEVKPCSDCHSSSPYTVNTGRQRWKTRPGLTARGLLGYA